MYKTKKVLDMRKLPKKYSGQWVAVISETNKVVGYGDTPKDALIASKDYDNVILTRVPIKNNSYLL